MTSDMLGLPDENELCYELAICQPSVPQHIHIASIKRWSEVIKFMLNLLLKPLVICGLLEPYGQVVICVGTQETGKFCYTNNCLLVIHLTDKSKLDFVILWTQFFKQTVKEKWANFTRICLSFLSLLTLLVQKMQLRFVGMLRELCFSRSDIKNFICTVTTIRGAGTTHFGFQNVDESEKGKKGTFVWAK